MPCASNSYESRYPSNTHLDKQAKHNAGLQEGKVLAQAVARSLNEWDKLHKANRKSEKQ